jgi:hypothetical protein
VPRIVRISRLLAGIALLAAVGSGCSTVQQTLCETPATQANGKAQPDGLDAPVADCDCSKEQKTAEAQAPEEQETAEPHVIAKQAFSFTSKGDELAGVIDRPETITEPLPAVVVLHDSGPMDRRGLFKGALGLELPVEVPVYQEIAENLAQNGYVVMRFDKRTCVDGGPPWCEYPRDYIEDHREKLASTLMADAKAAVTALRKRKDVDPTRVFILGHGQGAELALAVAGDVEPRGLVLLAPSPYPVDEVVLHQTQASRDHLAKRRRDEGNTTMGTLLQQQLDALETTHEKQKKAFEKLRADEEMDGDVLGAPETTWAGLFELHDRAMASVKNSQVPVLALFGEHDLDIPSDSAEKFQTHLGRSRKSEVMLLPDVTRVMVGLGEEQGDTTQVSEDVHQAILHFFDELDKAPAEPDS